MTPAQRMAAARVEQARARRVDAMRQAVARAAGPALPPPVAPVVAPVRSGRVVEDGFTYPECTFSVAVSHCPWLPDRAANMTRMRSALSRAATPYVEITDRAPNDVWSRRMWGWGAAQASTHTVYLQDDLVLCPDFWSVVEAMVRAVPNRILALISNHPLSERALLDGHAWLRMSEVLGSGYIVPTALMAAFLDWRDRRLGELRSREGRVWNEDFQITCWLARTGRRAWCPIPSPIQTQDTIATTNAAEGQYLYVRSYLDWADPRVVGARLADPDYWRPRAPPPDFGPCVQDDWRTREKPLFADALVRAAHHRIARGLP